MTQDTTPEVNAVVKQLQDNNKGLVYQLDATKGFLNEQLTSNLNMRAVLLNTNENIQNLAKQLADAKFELADAKLENEKLHKDNANHLAKITELDAKLNPPVIPDNDQEGE